MSRYDEAMRVVKLFAAFVLVASATVGVKYYADGKLSSVSHVSATSSQKETASQLATDPLASITTDMNAAIAAQPDLTVSASLIDLDTSKEYDAGASNTMFTAASTSKLVAIFDYIHQVELGKATLTQDVGGYSAQYNIMRMIVYSDNDAWARLNEYLSFAGEQAYVNSLGINAVIQEDNMQFSTPNMAKLLQLLYQGKLMNGTNQAMIYDYMANTTITNLIQAALPSDATVYHKYGQLGGNLHDASIVKYQGHDFVLVIYTNSPDGTTDQYAAQVDLIHAITAAAFKDITAN
jgi:beta-lactamase class A